MGWFLHCMVHIVVGDHKSMNASIFCLPFLLELGYEWKGREYA